MNGQLYTTPDAAGSRVLRGGGRCLSVCTVPAAHRNAYTREFLRCCQARVRQFSPFTPKASAVPWQAAGAPLSALSGCGAMARAAGASWAARAASVFCVLSATPAMAAQQGGAVSGTGGFWMGISGLLALVLILLSIWDKIKFKPPLHRQFSGVDHTHSEYVLGGEIKTQKESCAKERLAIRQEFGNLTAKVERQSDHLRNKLFERIEQLDRDNNERARRIHERINPVADNVAKNKQAIEQHLEDHRAQLKGGE